MAVPVAYSQTNNETVEDAVKYRKIVKELTAKLGPLEQKVEDAQKNYRNLQKIEQDKKNLYDDNPNEQTRKTWDDAKKNTQDAFKNWNDLKQELSELKTELHNADLILVGLEKKIADFNLIQRITKTADTTKMIGIDLSESCIILKKNNMITECPSYEDLIQLDSSIQEWSGKFVYDEDGWYHREAPPMKNSWRLYDTENEFRIIVDPPKGMNNRIKMITIQPNLDTYILPTDRADNYTRILYHDRFVDNCRKAIINAELWEMLSVDTVMYMRHGCDNKWTTFNHIELIPIELVEHDISTSQKWKHDQWIKNVTTHCIFKYRAC